MDPVKAGILRRRSAITPDMTVSEPEYGAAFFIEFVHSRYNGECVKRVHGRWKHYDWLYNSDMNGSHQWVESLWREMQITAALLFYKGSRTGGQWVEKVCPCHEAFVEMMRHFECPTLD